MFSTRLKEVPLRALFYRTDNMICIELSDFMVSRGRQVWVIVGLYCTVRFPPPRLKEEGECNEDRLDANGFCLHIVARVNETNEIGFESGQYAEYYLQLPMHAVERVRRR